MISQILVGIVELIQSQRVTIVTEEVKLLPQRRKTNKMSMYIRLAARTTCLPSNVAANHRRRRSECRKNDTMGGLGG